MRPELYFSLKLTLLDIQNEVARQIWDERYLKENKTKIIKEQKERFLVKKQQLVEGLQREGFVVNQSAGYADSGFFNPRMQDEEFSVKLQINGTVSSNSFNPQQEIKIKIQNELLMNGFDSTNYIQVSISKNHSKSSHFESYPGSNIYSNAHTSISESSDSDDELNEFTNMNLNPTTSFHFSTTYPHDSRLKFTANVTAKISTFRHPEFNSVVDHISYMNSQQAEYGELMSNVANIISQTGYPAICSKWSKEKEGSSFEVVIQFRTNNNPTEKECTEFLKDKILPMVLLTAENCKYKFTIKKESINYCYRTRDWQQLDLSSSVELNNNNNNTENPDKERQLQFVTQRFFGSKSHTWIPAPSIPKTGPYAGHQVTFYKLTDQQEAQSFSANLTAEGFKNEIKETPQGHLPCITVDLTDSTPIFN